MELAGIVLAITDKYITICSTDKKQEFDVFYTDSNAPEVKDLIVGEMVRFNVRAQSVPVNGEKLARFWLWFIMFPTKKFEEKFKGKNTDWAKRSLKQ